jgi:hypothetical protein
LHLQAPYKEQNFLHGPCKHIINYKLLSCLQGDRFKCIVNTKGVGRSWNKDLSKGRGVGVWGGPILANSAPWALSDVKSRLSLFNIIFFLSYLVGPSVHQVSQEKEFKKTPEIHVGVQSDSDMFWKVGIQNSPHPLLTRKSLGLGTSIYDPIFFFPPPTNAYRHVILMFGKGKWRGGYVVIGRDNPLPQIKCPQTSFKGSNGHFLIGHLHPSYIPH